MPRIRENEFYSVVQAIDEGIQTNHISGQPGFGKSTFLEDIADELSDSYKTRILYVREGNSPTTLAQDLLHETPKAVGKFHEIINRLTGASAGLGPVSGGVSLDDRARHLQKLASLSESVKGNKRLIFFVDDVHKLDEAEVTR